MYKNSLRIIVSLIVAFSLCESLNAQNFNIKGYNTINTSVTFLTISPDSRSGGLGDLGAATSPDVYSMHYNPAKYAFIGLKPGKDPEENDSYSNNKLGFALNYSPWMRQLSPDINLFNVAGYYRLDEKSTVAASLTYFSLGEITFTNDQGVDIGTYNPNEFALDATYSRKFSPRLSGAVAGRFIYSNLTQGVAVEGQDTKAGMSGAADIAIYYVDPIKLGNLDGTFSLGANISNIGSKISYYSDKSDKEFIPTNLRISPALTIDIDDFNSFSLYAEFTKLLVPTSPISAVTDTAGRINYSYGYKDNATTIYGKNDNVSTIVGMIQSFYDAPGYTIVNDTIESIGKFREELQEINMSFGVEYWYNNLFALRAGYFYEHPRKGDRQFVSLGAGIKYNVFGLDISYLISTTNANPLGNTLRFSLTFNFGEAKQ